MLGQAVVMSLIVGFLIIYHTMSVSIIQRHREIGLLRSLGASRRLLLGWVGLEAVFLGLIASTFGVIAAVGLGRFAVRLFGPVTDSWIRLSPIPPTVSWSTALTAVVLGAATSLAATVWAGAKVLRHPIQPDRNLGEVATSLQTRLWRVLLGAGVAGLFFGVLTALPPRLASFSWIMAYTAVDLVLLFAAFGLASALPALWMGRAGVAAAKPRRGVGLLFAASTLSRSPTAPAAVVTAIVVAFAWTVGNAAYMASVRKTWLGWVDREYPPGRILVTTPEGIAGLKPPTFVSSVLGEIHSVPGVARVEGMRQTEAQFAGRPIVLQARDEPLGGFHLSGADWQDVAEGFRNGRGVFLDDNLARTTGMAVGDVAILESVDGPQRFLVLALLDLNVEGGDLGSIVIARDVYQRLWHDSTISRVRVTVEDGFDLADVAEQLNERLAVRYGLHATTWRQYRVVFAELINSAFAGTYALIFVGFAVSFIAIVNFLLAMLVERRVWYQRLHILSAASSQIRGTIVAEGAILGVVGSLIGIAAAVAVSLVVVFRVIPMVNGWRFDYTFPIGPVVFGFVGTVLLAVAAAAFPARLATRSGYLLGAIEE
jgi:putative ABC transport system permease protein